MKLQELEARQQAVTDRMAEIIDTSGELLTEDAEQEFDALSAESKDLDKKVAMTKKVMEAQAKLEEQKANAPAQRIVKPDKIEKETTFKLPASVRKWSGLKCFKDDDQCRADVKAYRFGQFLRGAVLGSEKAKTWCLNNGVEIKGAMLEDNNAKGGYLVPGEFDADLIRLVEDRGVFRSESRVIPMTQDTKSQPRRTGGTTAYFVGEGSAITASDMTIDLVTLVAKKLGVIVPMSNELGDDAVISVADMLAQDIAYAFADKEDECGFNGTGTSTYGGIIGVRQQLINQALGGTAAGAVPAASGLVRYGTGNGFANIGMDDLTLMIGKLPTYAEANAKWYMSKVVWSYLLDLMADAGGNTIQTISAGAQKEFLGYPVRIVDVMPKTAATNQVNILLGDLRQATTFGDRRKTSLAMSDAAYVGSTSMFESDEIAIRGIERFDINCHDVGSSTATGPVIGLIAHTA